MIVSSDITDSVSVEESSTAVLSIFKKEKKKRKKDINIYIRFAIVSVAACTREEKSVVYKFNHKIMM